MSTVQYSSIWLNPTGAIRGRELWIEHVLPIPTSALLVAKWTYILDRFSLWYEDADGDNITLGSFDELVAAKRELTTEMRMPKFQFRRGTKLGMDLLEDMVKEMRKLKMKFRAIGICRGQYIKLLEDGEFSVVPPERIISEKQEFIEAAKEVEEFIDPAIFDEPKPVDARQVDPRDETEDDSQSDDETEFFDSVPEHDDLLVTPQRSPSPDQTGFHDSPLIDLPFEPTHTPIAEDPPETIPLESEFPNPPFPGSFPTFPNDPTSSNVPLGDFHNRISTALQSTLDTLARFGHMTISAAQSSRFPVSSPETFTNARNTLDANTQTARTGLEFGLQSARNGIAIGLAGARGSLLGAMDGLTLASSAAGSATRQVEMACRNAAVSLQSSGTLSRETTERVIRDLRTAGDRMERAVEEMTLGLQRRIDRYALQPRSDRGFTGHVGTEGSLDSLPGAFPVLGDDAREARIEECAAGLVEMGYFGAENRDLAEAVSIAANGDMERALDIVQERE